MTQGKLWNRLKHPDRFPRLATVRDLALAQGGGQIQNQVFDHVLLQVWDQIFERTRNRVRAQAEEDMS